MSVQHIMAHITKMHPELATNPDALNKIANQISDLGYDYLYSAAKIAAMVNEVRDSYHAEIGKEDFAKARKYDALVEAKRVARLANEEVKRLEGDL
jgi:hypothetical protein